MTKYFLTPMNPALPTIEAELTEDQWFSVFVSGRYKDEPLHMIARSDDATKHVVFAESLDGQKLS